MTFGFLVGALAGGVLAVPILRAGARLDFSRANRIASICALVGCLLVAVFGRGIVMQSYPKQYAQILLGLPLATVVLLTLLVLREKQRDWIQLLHAGAGFFAVLVAGSELFLAMGAAGLPPASFPKALFYVGGPRSAAALGGSMRSSDERVRAEAVKQLTACGDAAAPVLQAAANDPSDGVREEVISLLRKYRSPATTSVMLAAVSDRSPGVRTTARYYFQYNYDDRLVAPILATLIAADSPTEVQTTQQLVNTIVPRISAALATQVTSDDAKVRKAVILALGDAPDASVVPVLETALKDPDPTIRAMAADALGNVGKEASHQRAGEVSALKFGGNFSTTGNPDARPPDMERTIRALTRALRDPQTEVQLAAAKGLALATTRSFNWNNHAIYLSDREGGMFAPRAIGEAVPALLGLTKHPDGAMRRAAARALVNCAGQSSAPGIIQALNGADPETGKLLLQALGYTEDPRAVAFLKKLPIERHEEMGCDICQSLYYLEAYEDIQHSVDQDRE